MINDFLDNLGAHQYQKMHMDKDTRKELEKVNEKLKGTIKEYLRCNLRELGLPHDPSPECLQVQTRTARRGGRPRCHRP